MNYSIPFSIVDSSPVTPRPQFIVIDRNPSEFLHDQFHQQHVLNQSSIPFNSSDPTPCDLPTIIALLKSIIDLSEITVSSLPASINRFVNSNNHDLCCCPFDPNHRMLPEFLFRHMFSCSSAGAVVDLSIFHSIRYRNTLKTESELRQQNRFVQTLEDHDTELFFELEDDLGAVSDFFYRSCPGVVSSSDFDNRIRRTFMIPGILSAECANFGGKHDMGVEKLDDDCLGFYPSELCVLRCEVESWHDFPATISYFVIRAIMQQRILREESVKRWLIANSPLYGIVIDVYMGDHMLLLFNLCLKSISREAFGLGRTYMEGKCARTRNFRCPVLVQVLKWLSLQISVLYGESNGRLLILNMFKQFLFEIGSSLLLISSGQHDSGNSLGNCLLQDADSGFVNDHCFGIKENDEQSDLIFSDRNIFVSQIAAAVSALHERFVIEEKIRALRSPQPLTNFQCKTNHVNFSEWANELRRKRSTYKPIIEHDGFSQPSENQVTGRSKTREELLAEERDYKRRRTSYRGKKSKRTTTEVMRDIIEEYMEQMTKSERKSHFEKDIKSEELHSSEFTEDPDKHPYESFESDRHYNKRISGTVDSTAKSSKYENSTRKHYNHHKETITGRDEYRGRTRPDRYRSNRVEHHSRSPMKSSPSRYTKKHNEDRSSSRYRHSKEPYSLPNSKPRTDHERRTIRCRNTGSMTHNSFDDRYDPFESNER